MILQLFEYWIESPFIDLSKITTNQYSFITIKYTEIDVQVNKSAANGTTYPLEII